MKNYNKILEAINRGIKFALDDFEDNEDIQGQTNSKVKYQSGWKEYIDLLQNIVDLDLPSGTLWCKYNLDVNPKQLNTSEDWYGKYYAWGELEGNKTKKNEIYFSWSNYKFGKDYNKLTKYCNNPKYGLNGFTDNLTQLLPEDDAAYQNKHIGNFKFHIPTKEQCEELIKYTKNYWVKNYDPNKTIHNPKDDGGIRRLNGYIFEGKNGNQLFFPAAGCHVDNVGYYGICSYCNLWSNSVSSSPNAYILDFSSSNVGISTDSRDCGFPIRPVINL